MALQIKRILRGDLSFASRQLFVDGEHFESFVSRYERNPSCRFDHRRLELRCVDAAVERTTPAELLDQLDAIALAVPGHEFVKQLACPDCASTTDVGGLLTRELALAPRCCEQCGAALMPVGLSITPELRIDTDTEVGCEPLADLGVRERDIVRVHRARRADTPNYELVELRGANR